MSTLVTERFQSQVAGLRTRFEKATLLHSRLTGQREAAERRCAELTQSVAQAKARLALAEEVQHIFRTLQNRAHERSLGAFERLLSAIVRDVLEEKGDVRLVLSTRGNTPALDIRIENAGHLEDALDGNGGAVANVLSAGLRFAALSRTGNRRLMVLDEPDCWITPERVPSFVSVIAQVSHSIGVQTFFISHHDAAYFEDKVNLVRFSRDAAGRVRAEAMMPVVDNWADDEQEGIRSIELVNFRAHEHTVVPCFPGATAFIGDNDLGKSTAIVSSFRAVAYGESDDSMVRHGAEEARIVMHLERKRRLVWTRNPKRNPVVMYQLFDGDELVAEGRPSTRNSAPDWVVAELGISRVDDLDVQLGNQKAPVFLLDQSSSRRAQILSVGRESGHLSALMTRYEELRRGDRERVRNGEIELHRVTYAVTCAKKLDTTVALLEQARPLLAALESVAEGSDRLRALVERLSSGEAVVARLEAESRALAELPETPALSDVAPLARLIERLAVGEAAVARHGAQSRVLAELPALPVLVDTVPLARLIERLAQGEQRVALLSRLPEPIEKLPELHDLEALRRCGEKISKAQQTFAVSQKQLNEVEQECRQAAEELEALKDELGGQCPLCGSVFPEEGIEHVHTHGEHEEPAASFTH
jgi:DNA repair exonuclease SbcCD ATPase subunit